MDAANRQVYWEKQGKDKLCAVHTLNALMQQPAFDEFTLGAIAQQLDAEESRIMGGPSIPGGESHNVDADGNFSLPVMERALNQYDITLVNLDRPDVRSKIMSTQDGAYREEAYVCNSHRRAHWFCLRKVFSKWYDFDSLKPAPTFISDSHLNSFLESTMSAGFTVFVVRPPQNSAKSSVTLPPPDKFLHRNLAGHQHFLNDRDMDRLRDEHRATEDKEMKDAQKLGEGGGDGEDGDGKPAFTMVVPSDKRKVETDWSKLGAGNTLSGGGASQSSQPIAVDDPEMDADMRAAIAASLADVKVPEPQQEPDQANADAITIQFRFKSDPAQKRRFLKSNSKILDVVQYLEHATTQQNLFPTLSANPAMSLIGLERYAVIKQGFPKKEKFVRCNLSKRVYLDGEDVTDASLLDRKFEKQEAMILQLEA
ncbi:unnamed protein product [Amoebophrya sp. A120]|nr:unnamed protein product [Amoebophrya sp. A120]|eukprot:GSA120T00009635001.1